MYCLYQTTNLENGRYYIGVHRQSPGRDSWYYGSGVFFRKALKKYGTKSFRKDMLATGLSRSFAYRLEAAVVTDDFVARHSNYNAAPGGRGGPGCGRGPVGYKHTDEAKRKIATRCGWKHKPETLQKMSNKARNRSADYLSKLAYSQAKRVRLRHANGRYLRKDEYPDEFRRSPLAS